MPLSSTPVVGATACASDPNRSLFSGMGVRPTGMLGARAFIERFDPELCTQGPVTEVSSWALSWVSIDGPTEADPADGINIFQGGIAKCSGSDHCPWNLGNPFHFYYFAHSEGACSPPFNTKPVKLENVGPGSRLYEVSRRVAPPPTGAYWAFLIDGTSKHSRRGGDIMTCWGSIIQLEFKNEMMNVNDYNPGLVSNHQHFAEVQYQTSNGWHDTSWTLGRECDAHSDRDFGLSNWRCFVSSTDKNDFYQWDARAP
ncbi:MAG TPA: hypothetical protein VFK38_08965 [Candidatus Limnocylindrales bacterium]|nr:hypothetical protein [Candidatus Limnocylindrales bacterium]